MAVLGTQAQADAIRTPAFRSATRRQLLLALAALATPAMARASSVEYAVKATYLCKFAPFVEWPAAAFPSRSSPFNVCIVGDDPFGAMLDQAVSGQRLGDHPMRVRRLERIDGSVGCHILYAGGSARESAADVVRRVRGAPVLTVTDESRGGGGGIIQFVVKDGRVRFEVDAAAAAVNQVAISAKLLSLALAVRPRS
jgi:hypothetical protein